MSMCDVTDLLDYWQEWPPAHLVLKAAFLKDTGSRRSRSAQDEEDTRAALRSLLHGPDAMPQGSIGVRAEAPAYLREVVEWADQERAKMGRGN